MISGNHQNSLILFCFHCSKNLLLSTPPKCSFRALRVSGGLNSANHILVSPLFKKAFNP